MPPVVKQAWTESERGWGTRPDGFSYHLSEDDRRAFIKAYWARMPESTPDEYSFPDGNATVHDADDTLFEKIKASKNGVRSY